MSATYSVHDNVIVAPSIATAAFGGGLTPSCSNMDIISNETLMQILVTLTDGEDIKAARLVNKYIYSVTKDNYFLYLYYMNKYGPQTAMPHAAARYAVQPGVHGTLERLLNTHECDVNALHPATGRSALHYAACKNNEPLITALVQQHANVNVISECYNQYTPLHLSIIENDGQLMPAFVALLAYGADPLMLSGMFQDFTAVHEAASASDVACLHYLLNVRGVDPAAATSDMGITAMHCASSVEAVDLLADHTPPGWINLVDSHGVTAFMCAVNRDQIDVVRRLAARGAIVDTVDISGRNAAFYAKSAVMLNVLQELGVNIHALAGNGHTVLHNAISLNYGSELVQAMIQDFNIDVLAADDDGMNIFHHIVDKSANRQLPAIISATSHMQRVQLLNQHSFDMMLDYPDLSVTPIHAAVLLNNVDAVQQMLASIVVQQPGDTVACHAADVLATVNNPSSGTSETPLMLAVSSAMAQHLTSFGADAEYRDIRGNTALVSACFNGAHDVARELLALGCDKYVYNFDGNTALHAAATSGSIACINLLQDALLMPPVSGMTSIHSTNTAGDTILMATCRADQPHLLFYMISQSSIDYSPLINVGDLDGFTPLMVAVISGSIECVDVLLACGANVKARNNSGMTALDILYQMESTAYMVHNSTTLKSVLKDAERQANCVNIRQGDLITVDLSDDIVY